MNPSMVAWDKPTTIRIDGTKFANGSWSMRSVDDGGRIAATGATMLECLRHYMDLLVEVYPSLGGQKRPVAIRLPSDRE